MVGPDDLTSLFQPKWFSGSLSSDRSCQRYEQRSFLNYPSHSFSLIHFSVFKVGGFGFVCLLGLGGLFFVPFLYHFAAFKALL